MTTISIDLAKEPELAALVADKQPGDKITLFTSIKDNNPQTLELTIEDCEEGKKDESEETDEEVSDEEETGADEAPAEAPAPKPEKSYGKKYLEASGG